jgi:vancomycin resistance protein VanJ
MKPRLKGKRRLLLMPIDVYGMMTVLVLLAQGLIGERWNLVAFFNTFAQILWLPALCLIPLALLLRSRRTLALLLPAALAFIITFGDHFLPHAPLVPTADQTTFTLMTFNLLDDGRDPTGIVDLIASADADVVALQELNATTAEALEARFADIYPYRALHSDQMRFRGMGVMSKYPITADRYWHYDWMKVWLGYQSVVLDIAGRSLTLYNLHPIHPGVGGRFFDPAMRNQEIAALLEESQTEKGLFMMAGDFNMPELSGDYARITQEYGFIDAYRVRGWGLGHTFTHNVAPFLRLDYMFLRHGVDVAEIKVWPSSGGGDHRPVWATLVLDKP